MTANHCNGRKKIGRLVSEEDGGLMEASRTVKGSVSAGWHVPLCVAVFFDNRLAWPTGVDPPPLLRQPTRCPGILWIPAPT